MLKGHLPSSPPSKRVYRLLPDFDSNCNNCALSCGSAIGGHTFGGLSNVNLIIIAPFPSREELKKGFSFAPNLKTESIDKPNAGRFFQYSTIFHFDWDVHFPQTLKPFYDKIAFTNILKCSPFDSRGDKVDIKDHYIRSCKIKWLEKEINVISKYNPTCPILLCGTEAAKLLHPNQKLYSSRRTVFTYNSTHPTLITFNPLDISRYTAMDISSSSLNLKGKLSVQSTKPIKPVIVGSPTWHWNQDMILIKKLVVTNYNNVMGLKETL